MILPAESWKARAAAKVASTKAKIAPEWRLSEPDLEKATKQRDLTGAFIQQYLTSDELEVIQQDAVFIVTKIKAGEWSAKRVTLAFCKTAAIAYQIVYSSMLLHSFGYNCANSLNTE
jgi:amidase